MKQEMLYSSQISDKRTLFGLVYASVFLLKNSYEKYLMEKHYNFALASAGSFSRRELAPYSDIDLMFISESVAENENEISSLVKTLWDNGIEVSHTVRDFTDLQNFLHSDIHTFTQFFETRFLLGNTALYKLWNESLFDLLNDETSVRLLKDLIADLNARYLKNGDSPKILEPNVKSSAGGVRDLQFIEWMYIIKHKTLLSKQFEISQAEYFINLLMEQEYTTKREGGRVLESYRLVMAVRNMLHLISEQKNDRFEFNAQKRISNLRYKRKDALSAFMQDYFKAANIIHRFSKAMVNKFIEEITNPLPDALAINLDEQFILKGKTISLNDHSVLHLV